MKRLVQHEELDVLVLPHLRRIVLPDLRRVAQRLIIAYLRITQGGLVLGRLLIPVNFPNALLDIILHFGNKLTVFLASFVGCLQAFHLYWQVSSSEFGFGGLHSIVVTREIQS